MEKPILNDREDKIRGYKISVNVMKDGSEGCVYLKKSIRKANGACTSCSIANLGMKKDLGDDGNIIRLANEAYRRWKEKTGKATVIFSEDLDCEEGDIQLGKVYIFHFLQELGIMQKLDSLKGEKRSKYQFSLKNVVATLICSQILNPGSKRHMFLSDETIPFPEDVKLQHIYRALDILALHHDEINAYSYKRIRELAGKKTKVYFFDCTNFYYTQGSEGELLGFKKSKEGIYAPLVQMGLLIDEWGYLVGMIIFRGNRNEQGSLEEQVRKIEPHVNMQSVTVCTDAGLCSFTNKMLLSQKGRAYITTQPITGKFVPDHIKSWVTTDNGFKDSNGNDKKVANLKERFEKAQENGDYAEMNRILSQTIYKDAWFELSVTKRKATREKGKNRKWTEVPFDRENDSFREDEDTEYKISYSKNAYKASEITSGKAIYSRLLVSFSMKYYLFQKKELEEKRKMAERIVGENRRLDSIPKELRGFMKCEHATGDGEVAEEQVCSIDEEGFREAEKYLGYYVQATNLGDRCHEIYETSRMRWQIEYCFRSMKSSLDCRPIYLSTENHIVGHFTVVFLALQTMRYMMYKLYGEEGHRDVVLGRAEDSIVTIDSFLEELRNMRGRRFHAQEGYDFINGSKKNDMNILMAKAFKLSLTKQVLNIEKLESYCGMKI